MTDAPESTEHTDLITRISRVTSSVVKERPRLVLGYAMGGLLVTAAVVLILGHEYTSTLQITPQIVQSQGLQSLAAQVGIDVSNSVPGESPAFYAALVTTPTVLRPVASASYPTVDSPTLKPLDTLLRIHENTRRERIQSVIDRLQTIVSSNADRRTGAVKVTITTRDPLLSKAIADSILSQIRIFDSEVRESQGHTERAFLERRLDDSRQELHVNEDALRDFVMSNRSYQDDPRLQLEFNRLQREVTATDAVVAGIRQEYEQARVDEVRDTPVITIVELPAAPVFPDRRHLILKALLGFMLGTIVGVGVGSGVLRTLDLRHWAQKLVPSRRGAS